MMPNATMNESNLDVELALMRKPPTYILVTIYLALAVLITVGNALVIMAMHRDEVAKKETLLLVKALALADLLVGCVAAPCTAFVKLVYEDQGIVACLIAPTIQGALMLTSMFLMILIAVERHRSIVRYDKSPYTVSQIRWMIIAAHCTANVLMSSNYIISYVDGKCGETDITFHHSVGIFILVSAICCSLAFLYIQIIRQLNLQLGTTTSSKARIQQTQAAVKSFFACFLWYGFSFFPTELFVLVRMALLELYDIHITLVSYYEMYVLVTILAYINSFVNPVLYAIINVKMR